MDKPRPRTVSTRPRGPVTMPGIAPESRVAQTAVSFVLNDRNSAAISSATRDRGLTTARNLGAAQSDGALARDRAHRHDRAMDSVSALFLLPRLTHEFDQRIAGSESSVQS